MRLSNGLRALALAALATLGGCASFPQHQVPTVAKPAAPYAGPKPSVFITVTHYMGENPGTEMRAASDLLRPVVTSTILDSGLVDPTPYAVGDKTDLKLDVTINNVANAGAAAALGIVGGLTLGVIPVPATDNYKVKLKVSDASGAVVGSTGNQDAVRTWIGWIFLPMAGKTPEKAVKSTIANQVLSALNDAYASGLLKAGGAAAAAAP